MSLILHIDSSSALLFIGLSRQGILVDQLQVEQQNEHLSQINTYIKQICDRNELSLSDLDAVAVLNGPGSYTGLRIALASAKAFCISLQKKLIAPNLLQVMAACCEAYENVVRYPLIKAMKNEYYCAGFDQNHQLVFPYQILSFEELMALKREQNILIYEKNEINTELSTNGLHNVSRAQIYEHFVRTSYLQLIDNQEVDVISAQPFYIKNTYIAPKL